MGQQRTLSLPQIQVGDVHKVQAPHGLNSLFLAWCCKPNMGPERMTAAGVCRSCWAAGVLLACSEEEQISTKLNDMK